MATLSLSELIPSVKNTDVFLTTLNGKPAVSSLEVANHFQKKHQHVLRDIERIISICPKSFCASNFGRTSNNVAGPNGGSRETRAYLLTRDAFSILVMGFTGKAALHWKLRYIEAFNTLEELALANTAQTALKQGMALQKRLTPKRRALIRKTLAYKAKGLQSGEIGKLIGTSPRAIAYLLADAKLCGIGG